MVTLLFETQKKKYPIFKRHPAAGIILVPVPVSKFEIPSAL